MSVTGESLSNDTEKRSIWKFIGPGLCMAGAAIGVSHIMQSTRAGAHYGFALVWLVVLVNILKYPAFKFGHWFTASTGKSLIDGYRGLGKGQLALFQIVCTVTGIGSIGAVSYVTGALAWGMVGQWGTIEGWSLGIMIFCATMLIAGHYHLLNDIVKYIMILLAVATLFAFGAALVHGPVAAPEFEGPNPWTLVGFGFIIALLGWMPAPIEVSVMQSLWVQAKQRDDNQPMTKREAMVDFNIGYILTMVLAVVFVSLGALVMFGSGTEFAASNVGFTNQLTELYTTHLGGWIHPIISFAAFTAMFSTTITVIDGYTRCLSEGLLPLFPGIKLEKRPSHNIWLVIGTVAGAIIIFMASNDPSSLTRLVDIVTVLAFLTAPFFAALNHWVVFGKQMTEATRPSKASWLLSWAGLIFLTVFSVVYIYSRWIHPV